MSRRSERSIDEEDPSVVERAGLTGSFHIRLVGAILLEQDDESAVAEHRYSSAGSMKQLTAPEPLDDHARDPGNDCVGVTELRNGAPEFHQLTGHFPNTSASVGRGRELITRDPIGTASLTRSCLC